MQRHLLGILALALLAGGAWYWLQYDAQVAGLAVRAGAVLAAIWLALPQLQQVFARVPPWIFAAVGIMLLLMIVRRETIFIFGPLLILLGVLHWLGVLLPKRRGP